MRKAALKACDDSPLIGIVPHYADGHPYLLRKGIRVDIIVWRFQIGESVGSIAADYGCTRKEIEEAIRCGTR